ncbi:hypothetical protein [Enterobacter hormaechei]|uniref:hypothetical protein n=1 Tax=Enterobacter hormaechei TaxID=158836 RepID=UPI00069B1EDC|nr:hypothetical protein [Enterobacter hormaechei]
MSELTKEWLQQTIAELEEERDAVPGAVNEDAAMALAAMKRALASLMAEPDYYVVVTSVGVWQSFCKTKAEAEFIVSKPFNPGYSILEIYTAPPAPVSVPDYPETLPCPVMLEPGLRFGKGVTTKTMLGAMQRRAEHYAELEAMTPEQRAEHEAGMKEFAAMLQGANQAQSAQQNIPENIPTLREAVDTIRSSGISTDAEKIHAERDSLNSPVIPDGYVLVPVEPTEEMIAAAMCSNDVLFDKEDDTLFRVQHGEIWRAMLSTAPQQEVTQALAKGMERYGDAMQELAKKEVK